METEHTHIGGPTEIDITDYMNEQLLKDKKKAKKIADLRGKVKSIQHCVWETWSDEIEDNRARSGVDDLAKVVEEILDLLEDE